MKTEGIVILKSRTGFESQLDEALDNVKEVELITISDVPLSEGGMAAERQKIVMLEPNAILVEIESGYDYVALIKGIRKDLGSHQVNIVGVLDGTPDGELVGLLPEIPVDSYVFSDRTVENILQKVDALHLLQVENDKLLNEVQLTSQTAMTAMKAASEIGILMQLIEWLQSAVTPEDVSGSLFKVCASFDLHGFCLTSCNENYDFFPKDKVPENIQRILIEANNTEMRIFSKNKILLFKLDYLVFLVTNAPYENEEQYGRFRDILLQACVLAEAKIRTLVANKLIADQHEHVSNIMMLIRTASAETQMYAKGIMEKLSNDLSMAAVSLDLTEEQENTLKAMSDEAYNSIEYLYANAGALEMHFHTLVESISKVKELTTTEVPVKPTGDLDDGLF